MRCPHALLVLLAVCCKSSLVFSQGVSETNAAGNFRPAAGQLPQPIFHASFDGTTTANISVGGGQLLVAATLDRQELLDPSHLKAVSIAKGEGRTGDALRFAAKTKEVVFYEGIESGYQARDWSGSVSVWLKLDPNADLEPGFCDPLQITQRAWNDAAFFIDFDKELPRDFRLGVFADLRAWNPQGTPWEKIPVTERPMVVVRRPPFSSTQWTHVCFTWSEVNSSQAAPATCNLYLNGQGQGTLQRPLTFSWDPQRAAVMLGINYIGLMDELKIFPVALTAQQVQRLSQ